jgi:tetratricopeptide (TPR) repeat protein
MIWPFGEGPIGSWRERRRALREMKRVMAVEEIQIASLDSNPLHRAKVSLEIGDRAAARHYFQLARERIPNYVLTSPETIDVLLGLHEFAQLEALALEGARRFPREPHYLEGYALAAERAGNFDEAIRRWALARKKFPTSRWGYVAAVGCLRQCGRLDEASALLRRAMTIIPDDITALFEFGRIAEARGDWNEAYRCWYRLRSRHVAGFLGAALALHKLGRTTEGEVLLVEARQTNMIEPLIPVLHAQLAQESGNIAEALKRWAVVRERFPLEKAGYAEGLRLLRGQRDWAEADAVAQAAIYRFPAADWPLVEYASLAHDRHDWAEAAKRWAAVRAAFPGREDAPQREAEARAAAEKMRAG